MVLLHFFSFYRECARKEFRNCSVFYADLDKSTVFPFLTHGICRLTLNDINESLHFSVVCSKICKKSN